MRTARTVAELRAALAPLERPVALVPTMGAVHDGHLALVARARALAPTVVVSLFVNPRQFGDAGDLAAYPRDEQRDAELLAGADLLWAPDPGTMYPAGFATTVSVGGPAEPLEGEHRGRAHFDGVATVVTKLLNQVRPDVAVFGQKDAQQVAVVRRLVADLDLPVAVDVVPTVRDADGLALSSRNARLGPADRERALALGRALRAGADAAASANGAATPERVLGAAHAALDGVVEPEYLALVDPDLFSPVRTLDRDAVLAVAARVGGVRLIDNAPIRSSSP